MNLDDLYAVIASRKGDNPEESYTASLFDKGIAKIAQKVGEEAVETVIEEAVAREIIPVLKSAGAEGIIEYPLNKVVH